ncbi:MAG: hypothetical protein HOW73_08245 [Polyangiaceae bacterium]|nr:hypothetical protein [Polyangiaceae bacterium]
MTLRPSLASIAALLVACSKPEPIAPIESPRPSSSTLEPAPVEPTTAVAPSSPNAPPTFTVCDCDGKCEDTETFLARLTDEDLSKCEAGKAKRSARASTGDSPQPDRQQRALDCFFPGSGTRVRRCNTIAPDNRPDFDAYLRNATSIPRRCFDVATARGLEPWGMTEINFRLGSGGYVQDIQVDATDPALSKCIAEGLERVSFATFAGDVTRVRYRLVVDKPR